MLAGSAFDNITRARNAIFVLPSNDYRKTVLLSYVGRFRSQPPGDSVDADTRHSCR